MRPVRTPARRRLRIDSTLTDTLDTPLHAWLQRLGLDPDTTTSATPDLALLRTIHAAHIQQVPFENLDIHLGLPIVLTIEALQAKQVDARQGRGGFCYELNGLLAHHLRALGYTVTLLRCHFRHTADSFGPAFDHLALLVTLQPQEQWLLDVGSILHPLRLTPGDALQPDGGTYRLLHDAASDVWTLYERRHGEDAYIPQFRFDRSSWELPDYVPMCHEQATSPESHFTHGRMCTRATPTGRITLSEQRLIVTDNGVRQETAITSNAAFEAALWEHFGIDLRGADWQPPLAPPTP